MVEHEVDGIPEVPERIRALADPSILLTVGDRAPRDDAAARPLRAPVDHGDPAVLGSPLGRRRGDRHVPLGVRVIDVELAPDLRLDALESGPFALVPSRRDPRSQIGALARDERVRDTPATGWRRSWITMMDARDQHERARDDETWSDGGSVRGGWSGPEPSPFLPCHVGVGCFRPIPEASASP